jgi:hypothetical protein
VQYFSIEGPLDLLERLSKLDGVDTDKPQPVDGVTDVLHSTSNKRLTKAAAVLGVIAATFQAAGAVTEFARTVHEYVASQDDSAEVVVVDPLTGDRIIRITSGTTVQEIEAAVRP